MDVFQADSARTVGHPRMDGPSGLNARQWEISRLIAQGLTNAQIGAQLQRDRAEVAQEILDLQEALSAGSRLQLAQWALERGASG